MSKNRFSGIPLILTSVLLLTSACNPDNPVPPISKTEASKVIPTPTPAVSATPKVKAKSVATTQPKIAAVPEPKTPISAANISQEPNQSNTGDSLGPVPLAGKATQAFLDIRGFGDSGMAVSHQQPYELTEKLPQGVYADFAQRLQQFDPTQKSYRGDLSYLNWESTVGIRCQQFWAAKGPRSFAFMSHPDNLIQAYRQGFNLIGLANNHARDCPKSEGGENGALVTSKHLARLSQEMGAKWLWHGVGKQKKAQVKTFTIKGHSVKIAFASLYMAEGDCTYVTCLKDEQTILRSLRDADADIRILALHSWTDDTQRQLVNLGVKFIQYYHGDIVFGSGPHRYKPVRVVESKTGKRGILFESLGNFIHPSLVPSSDHIMGRVLFDLNTLELRQVQIVPLSISRVNASFEGTPNPSKIAANLNWKFVNGAAWQSGVHSSVKGAYSNIKRSQTKS